MTALGRKIAGDAKSTAASRLSAFVADGARAGMEVELPKLGRAYIELIGSRVAQNIDQSAIKSLHAELGDSVAGSFVGGMLEFERAIRTLAEAVRDPDDHSKPFGTRGEWESLDAGAVNACWHVYGDVVEQLDPIDAPVTADELRTIRAAVEKKSPMLLRSFGVAKLSRYLLTTAEQLSASPTPSAGSGPSPAAS